MKASASSPSSNRTHAPSWASLVSPSDAWHWLGSRLVHQDARGRPSAKPHSLLRRFALRLYADHNDSLEVRTALSEILAELSPTDWGLNIGSGASQLHPRMLNIDIAPRDTVDIVTEGQVLPFRDNCLGAVISQEVLEHLYDPTVTVSEAFRVLRPGGVFYCQVPFMIGYHPGPNDYWRFSKEGVRALFERQPWDIQALAVSVGHGTGFYRVAVEFAAVTASSIHPSAYLPTKGLASMMLTPFKWADKLTYRTPQRDRIPGGYYCIARKP